MYHDQFNAGAVRDGAAERLLAALTGPKAGRAYVPAFALESDAAYYGRRMRQSHRAADAASEPPARHAHMELARRYARLARPPAPPALPGAAAERSEQAKRESELLDEALMATFPASDPVSVGFVR